MKKDINYIQCALTRKNYNHMAWIPERFAKVGKFIKIKKQDDTWEDGWEVMSCSDTKRTAKEADDASQLYKKTRIASDI